MSTYAPLCVCTHTHPLSTVPLCVHIRTILCMHTHASLKHHTLVCPHIAHRCACTHAPLCVHIRTLLCVHTHASLEQRTLVCAHTHPCVHTCTLVCPHTHPCVCPHAGSDGSDSGDGPQARAAGRQGAAASVPRSQSVLPPRSTTHSDSHQVRGRLGHVSAL